MQRKWSAAMKTLKHKWKTIEKRAKAQPHTSDHQPLESHQKAMKKTACIYQDILRSCTIYQLYRLTRKNCRAQYNVKQRSKKYQVSTWIAGYIEYCNNYVNRERKKKTSFSLFLHIAAALSRLLARLTIGLYTFARMQVTKCHQSIYI